LFVPWIAAAVCVVDTPPGDATAPYESCDGNLIVNGDFEQTDPALLGFTSDYRPYLERAPGDILFTIPGECFQATNCSNDNMWCDGVWVIGQNPANYHLLWWNTFLPDAPYGVGNFGDHTTNRGNMLIINGSTQTNPDGSSKVVWRQTVTGILPDTAYSFSFHARSVYTVAPPEFTVTAIVGDEEVQLSATPFVPVAGEWQQRTYTWNSGTATEATFEITSSNLIGLGNDYALDDIELCQSNTVCTSTDLISARHVDVGSVEVWKDDGGLRITYLVDEPWCFTEVHLAVGMYESDIPQTKKGSPIPGQFEYSYQPDMCEYVYTFPPLDMDPIEATCPMVIAAHAVVQCSDCQRRRTETAWGEGDRFTERDWSMYFDASDCYDSCLIESY